MAGVKKQEIEKQPVVEYTLDEIADRVFILESSGGKNDKCVREGLGFNGYGYGQSLTKFNCYDSYARVRELVKTWFDQKLETMSLEVALCHYNIGHKVDNCEYMKKFKNI